MGFVEELFTEMASQVKIKVQGKAGASSKAFSGSKGNALAGGRTGATGGGNSKLQVFLNGKIVTPQSLLLSNRSKAVAGSSDIASVKPPMMAAGKGPSADIKQVASHENPKAMKTEKSFTTHGQSSHGASFHHGHGKKNDKEAVVVVQMEESETTTIFSILFNCGK